jgi:hypothetical protein
MSAAPQHWKIYALGGGLGHFHRALALGRAATARGHAVRILANTRFAPHIPWEPELGERGAVTFIPPDASREATGAAVADWLAASDCDRLIVDTFPRGLAGELPDLLPAVPVPKTLVHRDLDPKYVEKYNLHEAAAQFDQLLLPGEDSPFAELPNARRTGPWLIRDAQDLLPASEARAMLGMDADDSRRLLLVCSTGRADEESKMKQLAGELNVLADDWCTRLISPIPGRGQLAVWPLLPMLAGVDALVGTGGYNLVHEARVTGTPLLARAQPRRYDRQFARLHPNECVSDVSGILSRLQSLPPRSRPQAFPNAVHQAAEWVERGRSSSA